MTWGSDIDDDGIISDSIDIVYYSRRDRNIDDIDIGIMMTNDNGKPTKKVVMTVIPVFDIIVLLTNDQYYWWQMKWYQLLLM